MKFGDTLYQRSVPEWAINNIDYNEIKRSIKAHTTNNDSRPRAIPNGSNDGAEAHQFEDRLYTELQNQHDRVNDFVHVKIGELSRRLAALDKQVSKLDVPATSHERTGFSRKLAERSSRLDRDIHRVGKELDSLSRFAQANSLAIRKLLKKYRRWTGSRALEERFRAHVFDRSSSFSKRRFEPLFAQYTSTLEAIRRAHAEPPKRHAPKESKRRSSTSSKRSVKADTIDLSRGALSLYAACGKICALEFDTAFATGQLGNSGARAVYWVHEDNIMNVQILLSEHTTQLKPETDQTTLHAAGLRSHSVDLSKDSLKKDQNCTEIENYGLVVYDDLQDFVRRRSSKTVDDVERSPEETRSRAVASIRLSTSEDVLITIDDTAERRNGSPTSGQGRQFLHYKAGRKAVRSLFRPSTETIQEELDGFPKWLSAHPQIKPLVKISCHRDRFCGVNNSAKGGSWSTLDQCISFVLISESTMSDKSVLNTGMKAEESVQRFPHAILEVRTEGDGSQALIKELDVSHLVERMRGFSMESHAIATLYKSHDMPLPYWIPALEGDIRKVPELPNFLNEREPKIKICSEPASTANTSLTIPSICHKSSSGGSQFQSESSAKSIRESLEIVTASTNTPSKTKRKRSQYQTSVNDTPQHSQQPLQQRYWNEFDDGSDSVPEDMYTIYVKPNTPKALPGAAMISRLRAFIDGKVKQIRGSRRPPIGPDPEREPLVNPAYSSPEDSELSDEENVVRPARRRYSTFSARSRRKPDSAKETVLLRSCVSAFVTSYILLFIAIILLSTGRREAIADVVVGVKTAVCAALVFSIVGVGSMMARRTVVGWIHRTIVLSIFLCAFLFGFALLAATNQPAR